MSANNNVKLFRIVDGTFIVGKITEESDTKYEIENMIGVGLQQNPDGGLYVSMGPAVHAAMAKVGKNQTMDGALIKTSVVSICDPSDTLEKEYVQMTSAIDLSQVVPGNL